MEVSKEKDIFGHPRALFMLFFAEMWERFSFYGMRALLILYLTSRLFDHLQDPVKKITAYGIYAAYGALVYTTPFLGGLIADKFLGFKKSVLLGAILMAIGHFVMAIETEIWLYIALAFLIVGNGFFKPNISSIVGQLYKDGDRRKDKGFTIFYMGINLGAFLAPLICGYIGETISWFLGFSIAGFGMLAGLFVFTKGLKLLDGKGESPNKETLTKKIFAGLTTEHLIYIGSFLSIILFAFMVQNFELMGYILVPFCIAVIASIIVIAFMSDKITRDRLFVILYLLLFSTLFWAFFEQAGSSISLFTNENVDRSIFGFTLQTSIFQSVNPFFIVLFAAPVSLLWTYLGRKKTEPNIPVKFAIGLFLLGLGFLAFYWGNQFISTNNLNIGNGDNPNFIVVATVPLFILILGYLLHTLGELCLSPIGLSMVTKLAPKKLGAMIMGAWFLSSAMAHYGGGIIASLTAETEGKSPVEEVVLNTRNVFEELDLMRELNDDEITDFNEKLQEVVDYGIKNLLVMSKDMSLESARPIDFKLSASADTCIAYMTKKKVLTYLNDTDSRDMHMRQTFVNSLAIGAKVILENGRRAMKTASDKGYIKQDDANAYSVSSAASLANLLNYNKVFGSLGLIAIGSSLLLLLTAPLVKRGMHGVN